MDSNTLVRFAAEKVGGEVCNPIGDALCVKTLFTTLDPTMCSGWHIHDLTSPDLFFKGLGVYYQEGASFQISPWGVKLGFQNMTFDMIEQIPEMFWQCWYELEKGGE